MNDTFLNNLREPPRQDFADALYQRINRPMKTTSFSNRPFAWVVATAVLAISLTLLISPAVRAAAQAHAGRSLDGDVAVFAELRAWKNTFR